MAVTQSKLSRHAQLALVLVCLVVPLLVALVLRRSAAPANRPAASSETEFEPRQEVDTSGLGPVQNSLPRWPDDAPLGEISRIWKNAGYRHAQACEKRLAAPGLPVEQKIVLLVTEARCFLYEGDPEKALAVLARARAVAQGDRATANHFLYTIIYLQGITGLRIGETENCVHCQGASACILPFNPAAVHQKPQGSRLAVQYFREYLQRFPNDLDVIWMLNVAHTTLGEDPAKADPAFYVPLDSFTHSEFNIGHFQDVGYRIGLQRDNQAGGAIMDDFGNRGLLDIVVTSQNPSEPMAYFRNLGNGRFQEATQSAGLSGELGGLNCTQGDYNNDGRLDIYITRGAWMNRPMRPSLLRNNGDGTFTNVTREAGLLDPQNSNASAWADYDNDGYLDLFVCREHQPNRLYHNLGNGKFEEVATQAGLVTFGESFCKGATWIDYDGDDYPDLFVNFLDGSARLFHNDRKGHFTDVTQAMGIDGPQYGFSCWTFDYDNDGWPDVFATCYERTVGAVVKGMGNVPHQLHGNRLFHNLKGARFEDATRTAGLDKVFSTMGSNFGDFDNDGFLDMYLSTGEPALGSLIPNRMFKNVDGKRFAEITATSGTGHLQKGHGVACGDWDRDGNVDLFVELGGAVPGDEYHNVLFQNPGHKNHWITVKLSGQKTNRLAIGARIKVVTGGSNPRTIYRWVNSGSSFGGNPLQQTIGLGPADRIATLEVHWPTSHTTQVFKDVAVDQAIGVTEFAREVTPLGWKPLPSPLPASPAL